MSRVILRQPPGWMSGVSCRFLLIYSTSKVILMWFSPDRKPGQGDQVKQCRCNGYFVDTKRFIRWRPQSGKGVGWLAQSDIRILHIVPEASGAGEPTGSAISGRSCRDALSWPVPRWLITESCPGNAGRVGKVSLWNGSTGWVQANQCQSAS